MTNRSVIKVNVLILFIYTRLQTRADDRSRHSCTVFRRKTKGESAFVMPRNVNAYIRLSTAFDTDMEATHVE